MRLRLCLDECLRVCRLCGCCEPEEAADFPSQSLLASSHTEQAMVSASRSATARVENSAPPLLCVETPAAPPAALPPSAHIGAAAPAARAPAAPRASSSADGTECTIKHCSCAEGGSTSDSSTSCGSVPSSEVLQGALPPSAAPAAEALTRVDAVHSRDSGTVDSLEAYNQLLGPAGDDSRASAEREQLFVETCAICCGELVLGPQQAITRLRIPPGELPRHFECGHALHSDCFAIYVVSAGRSCPICALDRGAAARAQQQICAASGGGECGGGGGECGGERSPTSAAASAPRGADSDAASACSADADGGWDGGSEAEAEEMHPDELEMLAAMERQEELDVLEAMHASLASFTAAQPPPRQH
uniref:RING-type domain-containing protein n=1 Tax=Calcidiscus leptoporus TaxID=127549 RepID=A0A7S0NRV9_9EUKA